MVQPVQQQPQQPQQQLQQLQLQLHFQFRLHFHLPEDCIPLWPHRQSRRQTILPTEEGCGSAHQRLGLTLVQRTQRRLQLILQLVQLKALPGQATTGM